MKDRKAPKAPAAHDDDARLFREEMHDVRRSPAHNRVEPWRSRPSPVPTQRLQDERAVLEELSRASEYLEFEEDTAYLRPGLPRDILRKLRRTHWVIQDDLDLHGWAHVFLTHSIALFDGLIAAWHQKVKYDAVRPISRVAW